ncbi:Uncharacterized protein DBV15_04302 [Temnothorax longispinosus]|uniref:Uncharacterized protein n=1 Tax=Temnothorax longispinosus TaxID=300112 RepID=A0A4S2KTV1_9HYME|nr:Uncharacterized protein DBV15_04302 [Temnothorax longispinosus]
MSEEGSDVSPTARRSRKSVSRTNRDNWRDSNGQSEEGGKKGEMEARTRHPKTGPVIPEIGTWNAGPRQELFPLSNFAFVSPVCLSSSFGPVPLIRLGPRLRMPLSSAIIKPQPLWSNLDNVTDLWALIKK